MTEQSVDVYRFLLTNSNYSSSSFLAMNEAAQLNVGDKVMDKVFEKMMTKYTKIDFGDIPRTMGDFTKFKHYKVMVKCIDQLKLLHSMTNKLPEIDVIETTHDNIIELRALFQQAFKTNNGYGIILYNTMCLACFEGVSLLISTLVDFIKNGGDYDLVVMNNSKSREHLLIKNMVKFNTAVADGTIHKYLREVTPSNAMHESIGLALTGGAILGLLALAVRVVPAIIKQTIYYFYSAKQNISDSAKLQATFLETSIESLKTQEGAEKVIAKQEKWVKFFKSISNKFAVKMSRANKEAETQVEEDTVNVYEIDF